MDRVQRAKRILAVQTQLKKLEDARMAGLEREQRELSEARQAVADAMGSDSDLHGLFLDVMARRLDRLAREQAVNAEKRDTQRGRVLEQGRKSKIAERLAEEAARTLDVEQQRKLLAEIAERYAVLSKS